MLEIKENSPTRLVIRLTHGLNVSTATFDKSSGRARFERAVLLWKRKPVEVALDDIESITLGRARARGETYAPLVQLKSGEKLRLADGGNQAQTAETVKQMRTFLGMAPTESDAGGVGKPSVAGEPLAASEPAAAGEPGVASETVATSEPVAVSEPLAPPSPVRRWAIGTALVAGAVVLVLGGMRVATWFSLPECDAELPRTAIKEIFAEKGISLDTLSDVRALAAEGAQRSCQARADIPGGFFNLDYRIEWEGWKARVTIVRADPMARIEPARLARIRRAVSDFLALARDSHTTGRAPRQSDPGVMTLLDTVFDTSELDGATLAASDIGRALDWFAAGERIGVVYMLAGTGADDMSKLSDDAASQQRTHRNVATFAVEFARFLDFQVKLAGAMADAALKRMAEAAPQELESPDVKRAFTDVRSTLADTMTGDLTSLAYEGVTDEWRRDRLAVLMEVAPKAAKLLVPEQARAVQAHALKVVAYVRNSFVQDTLKAFAEQVAR